MFEFNLKGGNRSLPVGNSHALQKSLLWSFPFFEGPRNADTLYKIESQLYYGSLDTKITRNGNGPILELKWKKWDPH